jgi:hypothetical protein
MHDWHARQGTRYVYNLYQKAVQAFVAYVVEGRRRLNYWTRIERQARRY